MSTNNGQLGGKMEVTPNTPVTPDRFWQYLSAKVAPRVARVHGKGIRASGRGKRADQVRVHRQGAVVELELEVMSKGWCWWLLPMFGTIGTTGPTDSAYTHTGTFGSLDGDSATLQVNNPLNPSGTDAPFTLAGCKVLSWELSLKDEALTVKLTVDATSYTTATALAAASYATAATLFDWVDFAVTIGGTATKLDSFTLKVDLGLNDSRYKIKGSALHEEQTHKAHPKVDLTMELDFADLTTGHDRVRAELSADAMAAVVITGTLADTGQLIGAATQPSITITMPKVLFNEVDGLERKAPDGEGSTQKLGCEVLYDGTNSMVTWAQVSADTTP